MSEMTMTTGGAPRGGSLRLVDALLRDPARRRSMSERGRALVDGFGAARAAEAVLERRKAPRGAGAGVRS